jgi:gamma-glutamyltranspeptidase/glutathione hydrolase
MFKPVNEIAGDTKTVSVSRRVLMSAMLAIPVAALVACGGGSDGADNNTTGSSSTPLTHGAVAAGDEYSAQVAKQILEAGGNAIDAAVATAFTLAVTYPEAGNIGGGGFMTVYMDGKPYFLDYRETAPAAATSGFYQQFRDAQGAQDPNSSVWGAQAVGVPGTVAGMQAAHQRFGKLTWSQVLAPALAIARVGHLPSKASISWREFMLENFSSTPYPANLTEYFGRMTAGVLFKQPELTATLERISSGGADEFYKGRTADLLVAAMTQDGGKGVITKADLAAYKPVWRDPISIQWNGMTVLSAPPPSSGGIALTQLLGMKATLAKTQFSNVALNSAQYIHLNAEMMKRVFADRATFLGDPDFVSVPVAGLLDPAYIAARAAEVNATAITPTGTVQPGRPKMHTTHYSIVDKWGNAVANTYTLNNPYGSGVIVRGAGFALNDEMDDFATVPGQPNSLGVIGGTANEVAPGKRPLSSMSPTIVLKDGMPAMVIGTPGGSRIFTAIYEVLTDMYDYNMGVEQAVANRRFHHQLPQGNVIEGEPYAPIPDALKAELVSRGYTVTTNWFDTDVQAIQIINGTPKPIADLRGHGKGLITN